MIVDVYLVTLQYDFWSTSLLTSDLSGSSEIEILNWRCNRQYLVFSLPGRRSDKLLPSGRVLSNRGHFLKNCSVTFSLISQVGLKWDFPC